MPDYARHAAAILADPWPAIKQQLADRTPSLLLCRDGILGTRVAGLATECHCCRGAGYVRLVPTDEPVQPTAAPCGYCDGSGRIHPDRRLGP